MTQIKAVILVLATQLLFSINVFSQNFKDGDIVFIKHKELLGKSILPNGKSNFNFVGIIFFENETPMVYYAAQPLSKCSFNDFIELSDKKSFQIKYLSEEESLTKEMIEAMHAFTISKLGFAYDNELKLDNEIYYNAEFVWKIYSGVLGLDLSIPRQIRDYKENNPTTIELLKESYGDAILDEKIVSIGDIFQSQFLD
jgi:hypothetical protein